MKLATRAAGVALAALPLLLPACASNPTPPAPAARSRPSPKVGTTAVGVASWYGAGYNGKRTACGDRFDQDALTAAHGSWGCDTRVRVTLLSTQKSVVVRINDLLPGTKGRLIDLSRGAAREIGLIGPGTGRVRLEVLK